VVELIEVREDDFNIDQELAKIKNAEVGGIVTFIGTVRDFTRDRSEKVEALNFEIYQDMALDKLSDIEQQAKDKYEIQDLLIIHRTGKLSVGENIVLVAVSASHRKPAFQACEFIIDELKKVVPIWKKEITGQDEHWVEAK
jgi:molybdopterin synthase catalytic subunit